MFATLVDARTALERASKRPVPFCSEYWDVYGHAEYLAALRESGQVLAFSIYLPTGYSGPLAELHQCSIFPSTHRRYLRRWQDHSRKSAHLMQARPQRLAASPTYDDIRW
ncbi:hypothetical protein YT1_p10049 (plasmid) [Rhodococcus ruber]|nr:hypothetical protein YT1_p10049 [Rhodococcus ruber]